MSRARLHPNTTITSNPRPPDDEPPKRDATDLTIGWTVILITAAPLLGAGAHLVYQWFMIGWNWI